MKKFILTEEQMKQYGVPVENFARILDYITEEDVRIFAYEAGYDLSDDEWQACYDEIVENYPGHGHDDVINFLQVRGHLTENKKKKF